MNSTEDHSSEETRRQHERFVASLERHGGSMTHQAWTNMATELGWTVEQVQIYAYRYLTELEQGDNNNPETEITTNGDSWSAEENILFESLLAIYLDESDNASNLDWEERVAAHLPGRTPLQVQCRYRERYVMKDTANHEKQHGNEVGSNSVAIGAVEQPTRAERTQAVIENERVHNAQHASLANRLQGPEDSKLAADKRIPKGHKKESKASKESDDSSKGGPKKSGDVGVTASQKDVIVERKGDNGGTNDRAVLNLPPSTQQ